MANPSEDMQWAYARVGADATIPAEGGGGVHWPECYKGAGSEGSFSGVKDFAKWTRALSEWLMTNSETNEQNSCAHCKLDYGKRCSWG